MKTKFPLLKSAVMLLALVTIGVASIAQLPTKIQKKNITTNTTWTANKIYFLKGKIYVTNGATLTIEPGTVITGDTTDKGSLIITRGSKIQAVGTPCQPIVFTSSKKPGKRARGDWGGLIILGYAQINPAGDTAHVEGITPIPETLYGGGKNPSCSGGDCPDNADNSGTLQYVRVEFAGVALAPNNEINGITFGGVGSGTTVDHVQVSYSNDDSFEWFGGAVNNKYLIAFRGLDDDFDTDNGYSGKNQFLVSLRDPKVADISGSKGFESDNDATGSLNLPQTRAVFSNITVDAGGDTTGNINYVAGAHIRRNSHEYIINSIFLGWPEGLLIDGATTENNVLVDTLVMNTIITATQQDREVVTTPVNSSVDNLLTNNAGNLWFTGNAGVKLTLPYKLGGPKLYPKSTSPALGAASFNHSVLNDAFFTPVTYVGAFDQGSGNDWTATWANWDPINTDYSNGASSGCNAKVAPEQPAHVSTAAVIVSPNPTKGYFKIALSGFIAGNVNIKVSALNTGRLVYSGKVIANTTSSVFVNATPGVYVVELNDGTNVITSKVNVIE